MFTVYATEDILAETIYSYRRNHPKASGELIARMRDRIVANLDDRITNYSIDETFPVHDKNDAHVHAAAVAAGATILLTADTGFTDLDEDVLASLPYEVHTPDSFFVLIDDAFSGAVREVTRQQLDYWYRRDGEVDLAKSLRKANCGAFAVRVSTRIQELGWKPVTG